MPTAAQFVVTGNPSGKPVGIRNDPYIDHLTTDTPLTTLEEEQLGSLPSMTADARHLLAGVFCRITTRDPYGAWAIGNWFYDPLERPGWLDSSNRPGYRRLHGSGDRWELQWDAHPHLEDLVSAMTDPVIGIPGAKAVSTDGRPAITFGGSTLLLHSRRA
ncbi:hypothetical protein RND61_32185 [Streptomyces sp. TRM76323]|uniref:Uncharacterized protein n=1 Tax=Streptomyces tamarix TaxID=3078565 RepID=A0ABU3QW34_9ACTN|nr:hypothetical protein [Streptomyces tamarix]MDT9686689.1 hypothetical protein [Streptomyces tamarix]